MTIKIEVRVIGEKSKACCEHELLPDAIPSIAILKQTATMLVDRIFNPEEPNPIVATFIADECVIHQLKREAEEADKKQQQAKERLAAALNRKKTP